MSQYFDKNPQIKSNKRVLTLYIENETLNFYSDTGVFCNTKIDYGSYVFLKELIKLPEVNSILDVGCGYGTLGITLGYFKKASRIDMVDINSRAIELTNENISHLKLDNCCNAFESDGFDKINSNYDMVVINPPIRAGKKVIYKMFEDAKKSLNDNGSLLIVIHKDLGANSAIKKLQELFSEVKILNKDSGYFIIQSKNY